jgi:hypothetical protein
VSDLNHSFYKLDHFRETENISQIMKRDISSNCGSKFETYKFYRIVHVIKLFSSSLTTRLDMLEHLSLTSLFSLVKYLQVVLGVYSLNFLENVLTKIYKTFLRSFCENTSRSLPVWGAPERVRLLPWGKRSSLFGVVVRKKF